MSDLVLDCVWTIGSAPPQPSTVITSQNIDSSHLSVSSVPALQTSPGTPSTERRHESGGSIGFSPCRPLQEDQNITSHLISDSLHGRPPSPILTLSYDDPHQTVPCRIVPGPGYNSNYNLFRRLLTPSHVIPWDENRSIPRRHQIIDDLQAQVEGIPSAGRYNRNSHPMSFDPEYKFGAREARFHTVTHPPAENLPIPQFQVPIDTHSPIEGSCPPKGSTVRLARVTSISPRWAIFLFYRINICSMNFQSPPADRSERKKSRQCGPSHENGVRLSCIFKTVSAFMPLARYQITLFI